MDTNQEQKTKEEFRQTVIAAENKGEELKVAVQKLTLDLLSSEVNTSGFSREKMKSFTRMAMEGIIEGVKEAQGKAEDLIQKAVEGFIEAIRNIPNSTKPKTREYLKNAVSGMQSVVYLAGDRIMDSISNTIESIMELKSKARVTFKCTAQNASHVNLVGSFNNWDPQATPLKKTLKGHWSITLTLPYGRYEYRYLIDNQWFTDPNTPHVPNEYGSENSVIIVGE